MIKNLYFLFLGSLWVLAGSVRAQPGTQPPSNFVGVRLGVLSSTYHSPGMPTLAFPAPPNWKWQAGLLFDLFIHRHYNARLELAYVNKGADITFKNDLAQVRSVSRLRYLQANLMPLILKPGFPKLNPYLGVGGYFSSLLRGDWKYGTPGGTLQPDPVTAEMLRNNVDYGLALSVGLYIRHFPVLELRGEWGLADLMPPHGLKNKSTALLITF
ncbi:hypothetical protein GCM10027275_18030 [Rhabdobacter roseus]|uniref:Outer membrane protein beta-barrel domain-containing protein n=1 Tax=Rhabdobacter roseus TaxID=1655419 RepID=A0A840TJX7_9BACT|nr:outer membrane beta-barrel protein [Rhabdobacter roseus]MBB5283724.1 hypothetical protein [Rhabdobacter roseus]